MIPKPPGSLKIFATADGVGAAEHPARPPGKIEMKSQLATSFIVNFGPPDFAVVVFFRCERKV